MHQAITSCAPGALRPAGPPMRLGRPANVLQFPTNDMPVHRLTCSANSRHVISQDNRSSPLWSAYSMANRLVAIGCLAILILTFTAPAPTAAARGAGQSPAQGAAAPQPTSSTPASPQREMVDRYCVGCHNQRGKAAGQEPARKITLDDADITHVSDHPDVWERVVRKMRAGMMPAAGARRPDKAAYDGLITWLEGELDRNASPYAPPPGLHRLNRTEYSNVIRDVLHLEADAAKYLPSDDSTHGFDNMAGALGMS